MVVQTPVTTATKTLKAEISWLKERIEKYMKGFNPHYLLKFQLEKNQVTLADVIWVIKK